MTEERGRESTCPESLYYTQLYFSDGNDYWNENNLTVFNGNENENNVDSQNENNIKIKMMSYKHYKNENVFKENER